MLPLNYAMTQVFRDDREREIAALGLAGCGHSAPEPPPPGAGSAGPAAGLN
jgi:hypothetical protein